MQNSKNRTTLFIIVGLIILLGVIFAFAQSNSQNRLENTEGVQESNENMSYQFACPNDYQFTITYSGEDNSMAVLDLPANQSYELSVARSGSGARYTNEDESVVFWEHQGEARVEIGGETVRENCVLQNS